LREQDFSLPNKHADLLREGVAVGWIESKHFAGTRRLHGATCSRPKPWRVEVPDLCQPRVSRGRRQLGNRLVWVRPGCELDLPIDRNIGARLVRHAPAGCGEEAG